MMFCEGVDMVLGANSGISYFVVSKFNNFFCLGLRNISYAESLSFPFDFEF